MHKHSNKFNNTDACLYREKTLSEKAVKKYVIYIASYIFELYIYLSKYILYCVEIDALGYIIILDSTSIFKLNVRCIIHFFDSAKRSL